MSEIITKQALPSKLLRLRWVFEYHDKPAKRGVWNGASPRKEDMASNVDKTGLKYAVIQGECLKTYELFRLAECPAADYVGAQWEAYARTPGLGVVHAYTPQAQIAGLSLITRTSKVTALVNGQVSEKPLQQAGDIAYTFEEHKAGAGTGFFAKLKSAFRGET